ncbi:uncharacterized protein LOC119580924 [Penaeus monodon]|uniref:uncharacterized protein LOC119580924 n=1 Tax=Penaeus monodon TaxID=6687 RepID=UPI0018A7D14C|nr:uncharacterized protein LOC119580924 [Penaeus monodon]
MLARGLPGATLVSPAQTGHTNLCPRYRKPILYNKFVNLDCAFYKSLTDGANWGCRFFQACDTNDASDQHSLQKQTKMADQLREKSGTQPPGHTPSTADNTCCSRRGRRVGA